MRLPTQWRTLAAVGGALLCGAALVAAQPAGQAVPPELRRLAARAKKPAGWPALRRYAKTLKNPEQRGWAYFVLGYRELDAQEYPAAAQDLQLAAQAPTGLADAATYFWARAARQAGDPQQAAEALKGFSTRFSESPFRPQAVETLVQSLQDGGQAQQAIEVLASEPGVRQRPSLALLQAQAFLQVNRLQDAAHAFQEVYYAFPRSPAAQKAADALQDLRSKLGAAYPEPSEQIQTARAGILYNERQFDDALNEYAQLLTTQGTSALARRWQLGRARCLLRLRRTSEALEALSQSFAEDPDSEAERLNLLVEAQARQDDKDAMLQALSLIESQFPSSPSYASALDTAGNYLYRQLDWESAARTYQRLADAFPQDENAPNASWRLAWCHYLLHDPTGARQAFQDYLRRYPDSSNVAGALYWLGRLEEGQEATSEAASLYTLLRNRFAQSYYALRAAERLKNLGVMPTAGDLSAGTLAASLASAIPPPRVPPNLGCASTLPGDSVQPVVVLQALSLDDLAEDYLRTALSNHPAASPEFRLMLSRLEAGSGNVSLALFEAVKVVPDYRDMDFEALAKELWTLLYPRSYWSLIRRYAHANQLDPYLVMGLIRQESAFDPKATSTANARGLMQLLPETASGSRRRSRVRAAARRLYSPAYNIRAGCAHLRGLLKTFDGKPELALAAYHAGESRVEQWVEQAHIDDPTEFLETIPISTTRWYVERVLRDAAIYRQLMTGSPRFAVCASEARATSPRVRKKAPPGRNPGKAKVRKP